jgi:hypothetical protein
MTTRTRYEWRKTAVVALALFAGIALFTNVKRAQAESGSWETDGILVNSTLSDRERLVLVDTRKQRILIYSSDHAGQFRLDNARCYKYDAELDDTSRSEEFEKKGGATYSRVYELFHQKK